MIVFYIFKKEIMKNSPFLMLYSLGLALLLSIFITLSNYKSEISRGMMQKYEKIENIKIHLTENCNLYELKKEKITIYGMEQFYTYDITISYNRNVIEIPDYLGGIMILNQSDEIPLFKNVIDGNVFSNDVNGIWLSDQLSRNLNCNVGDRVNLSFNTSKGMTVRGIYKFDSLNENINKPSFILTMDGYFSVDEMVALIPNVDTLQKVVKLLDEEDYLDFDGIVAFCNGFRVVNNIFILCTVLILVAISFFVFFVLKVWKMKKSIILEIFSYIGISGRQHYFSYLLLFGFFTLFSCVISFILGIIFHYYISSWASDLLNITVNSTLYLPLTLILFFPMLIILSFFIKIIFIRGESHE